MPSLPVMEASKLFTNFILTPNSFSFCGDKKLHDYFTCILGFRAPFSFHWPVKLSSSFNWRLSDLVQYHCTISATGNPRQDKSYSETK